MRTIWLALALLSASALAFGQLDSDTLSVTVARQLHSLPDQAVIPVTIGSRPTTTLDQVVSAAASVGITATNFAGLSVESANSQRPGSLDWTFALVTPLASINSAYASLAALRSMIGRNDSGLTLSVASPFSQTSPQAQPACPYGDLVTDARAQAQKIAAAGGFSVGGILTMTNVTGSAGAAIPVVIAGVFTSASFLTTLRAPQPPCSLIVKFQLLRYQ